MSNSLKSLIFGLFCLLASCADKEQIKEIPYDAIPIVYRGHLYIQGEADGFQGNFIFDTGASNFYFDSTYFSGNEYTYANYFSALLPGAGATPQKVQVIGDTVNFSFGTNLYQVKNVPILKLKPIVGDFADGIIGLDYFSDSVLMINYEQSYMRLCQSIDSFDVSGYAKIGLTKDKKRLFIPLNVRINDTITIAGNYQLDFGSGGSISLTSSATDQYQLLNNIEQKIPYFTKYGGVGGESSSYDFRAASVQIGDFLFEEVVMGFSTDNKGAMSSNKHLGLLGNQIYERFTVILDFANHALYLKPNSKFKDPFEFSKLGFSYVDRNETLGAWIVTGLFRGSCAEKAGLMIDDRIIAVNGVAVKHIGYEARKDFFKDLDTVVLTIEKNGSTSDIPFDLKLPIKS